MSGVEGRVALVTGASGAIGSAIARRLARGGAKVVCHYHGGEARAQAVVDVIAAAGGDATALRADVTVAAEVDGMVERVLSEWGHIDVLVNNAGITRDTLLLRMDETAWDAVLSTNLKSAYLCSRAVLRAMMRQRHGRILNIGSVVGIAGNPGQANYAAAKAGMIGLARSLAREVASRGITSNVLAPGFIEAGMTESLSDELRQNVLEIIPVKRLGTADDVAEAAAFLCSDEAGYITGQALQVDGGMVMG